MNCWSGLVPLVDSIAPDGHCKSARPVNRPVQALSVAFILSSELHQQVRYFLKIRISSSF